LKAASIEQRTEESYQRAIDYFRQAIEKDPNYALAYTGLADCYSFSQWSGSSAAGRCLSFSEAGRQQSN